jgi:predicted extracellular nuclease
VQNLFDLHYDGSEYKDYIPYKKSAWNHFAHRVTLQNISKVIKDLDADIVALEEIENQNALNELNRITKYRYSAISNKNGTSVKVAILSRFAILQTKQIKVSSKQNIRDILRVLLSVNGKKLYIFVNHWKSKRGPESFRVSYAKALKSAIDEIKGFEYILLGDFNSNYNELTTIKKERRLNNTKGITGINHILATSKEQELITKKTLNNSNHYNLWLELKKQKRFSYIYRGKNSTLDNIIIPKNMLDDKNIEFVSFGVFSEKYLFFRKRKINNWYKKRGVHIGKGYSDHLPIYAIFSIK